MLPISTKPHAYWNFILVHKWTWSKNPSWHHKEHVCKEKGELGCMISLWQAFHEVWDQWFCLKIWILDKTLTLCLKFVS